LARGTWLDLQLADGLPDIISSDFYTPNVAYFNTGYNWVQAPGSYQGAIFAVGIAGDANGRHGCAPHGN